MASLVSQLRRDVAKAASLRWFLLLLPALLITGALVVYPVIDSIGLAMTDWPGYGPKNSVGLDNFSDLLSDTRLKDAVWHSIVFAVTTAVVTTAVGTAIALALDRKVHGHKFFRFIIFLPVILPSTFIAIAWANGFDPYFGWAAEILGVFGIEHNWLSDPNTALYAVAAASILQSTGFPMIVVLAALGDIPREIHEAATLEGVTPAQRARLISVPLVRDVLFTVLLLQLIFGFSNFDFVYVMTNGGPSGASEVASTFVYHEAFVNQRFGYAAAAALVTSVLMALIAMVYMTIFRPGKISRAG